MNNQMDLYSTLSALLGKTISPDEELSLSDEEWDRLSASEKEQIAQLLEVAMHHPALMFTENVQSANAVGLQEPFPRVGWLRASVEKQSEVDPSGKPRGSQSPKRVAKKGVKTTESASRHRLKMAIIRSLRKERDLNKFNFVAGPVLRKSVQRGGDFGATFEHLSNRWDALRGNRIARSKGFGRIVNRRGNLRSELLQLKAELQSFLTLLKGDNSGYLAWHGKTESLLHAVNAALDADSSLTTRGHRREQARQNSSDTASAFRNWMH